MPLRYLNLPESQYIPRYTPVNEQMLQRTAENIGQQTERAIAQRNEFDELKRGIRNSLGNLSAEQLAEVDSNILESQNRLNQIAEESGTRSLLGHVGRESSELRDRLRPFERRNAQISSINEAIQNSDADPTIRTALMNRLHRLNQSTSLEDSIQMSDELNIIQNWQDVPQALLELDKLIKDQDLTVENLRSDFERISDNPMFTDFIAYVERTGRTQGSLMQIYTNYLLSKDQFRQQFRLEAEIAAEQNRALNDEISYSHFLDDEGKLDLGKIVTLPNGKEINAIQAIAYEKVQPVAMARARINTKISNIQRLTNGKITDLNDQVFLPETALLGDGLIQEGYESYGSWLKARNKELTDSKNAIDQITEELNNTFEALSKQGFNLPDAFIEEIKNSTGSFVFLPDLPDNIGEATKEYLQDLVYRWNSQQQIKNNIANQKKYFEIDINSQIAKHYNLNLENIGLEFKLTESGEIRLNGNQRAKIRFAFKSKGNKVSLNETGGGRDAERFRRAMERGLFSEKGSFYPVANRFLGIQFPGYGHVAYRDEDGDLYFMPVDENMREIIYGRINELTGVQEVSRGTITTSSFVSYITPILEKEATNTANTMVYTQTSGPAQQQEVILFNPDNPEIKRISEHIQDPSFLNNFGRMTYNGQEITNLSDIVDFTQTRQPSFNLKGMVANGSQGKPAAIVTFMDKDQKPGVLEFTSSSIEQMFNRHLPTETYFDYQANRMLSAITTSSDISKAFLEHTFDRNYIKNLNVAGLSEQALSKIQGVRLTRNRGLYTLSVLDNDRNSIHIDVSSDFKVAFNNLLRFLGNPQFNTPTQTSQ